MDFLKDIELDETVKAQLAEAVAAHTQAQIDASISGLKSKNDELLAEKKRVQRERDEAAQLAKAEAEEEADPPPMVFTPPLAPVLRTPLLPAPPPPDERPKGSAGGRRLFCGLACGVPVGVVRRDRDPPDTPDRGKGGTPVPSGVQTRAWGCCCGCCSSLSL